MGNPRWGRFLREQVYQPVDGFGDRGGVFQFETSDIVGVVRVGRVHEFLVRFA